VERVTVEELAFERVAHAYLVVGTAQARSAVERTAIEEVAVEEVAVEEVAVEEVAVYWKNRVLLVVVGPAVEKPDDRNLLILIQMLL